MDILSKPADEFVNDSTFEILWAQRAYEQAEAYLELLKSTNPETIQFTACDDKIYETFRKDFPDFNVGIVDEEEMKGNEGKVKWREFCEKFNKMEDYNEGMLLRSDCKFTEIMPDNCIFVHRIQFLAIEIARNREGYNMVLKRK